MGSMEPIRLATVGRLRGRLDLIAWEGADETCPPGTHMIIGLTIGSPLASYLISDDGHVLGRVQQHAGKLIAYAGGAETGGAVIGTGAGAVELFAKIIAGLLSRDVEKTRP